MASKGRFIDLHIHSSFSDGSSTPRQILDKAVRLGLAAVAITDHDTIEGSCEALLSGIPEALCFATGVEISASVPAPFHSTGALHLLGYFFDTQNQALASGLSRLQTARRERNPRIIKKLNGLGVDITMEEVEAVSGGGQVGRPHIAQVLVEKKVVDSMNEAFDRLLAKGKPAFEDKQRMPAIEAIALIRQAGGVPVMAHPSSLEMDNGELFRLMSHLAKKGLGGIEAYYPGHTPDIVLRYTGMAADLGLLLTGGSDFHGDNKAGIEMGTGNGHLRVPFALYEALERAGTLQDS